jgi:hypothetical protein
VSAACPRSRRTSSTPAPALPTPSVASRRTDSWTDAGYERLKQAAPGHVDAVRLRLVDRLTDEQMLTLGEIMAALLEDDEVEIETRASGPFVGP